MDNIRRAEERRRNGDKPKRKQTERQKKVQEIQQEKRRHSRCAEYKKTVIPCFFHFSVQLWRFAVKLSAVTENTVVFSSAEGSKFISPQKP